MQELYNIIPKSQQGIENMILYAQAKKVTISSGIIPREVLLSIFLFM